MGDPGHFDAGSLVTCDMMLAAPGTDFEGGDLCTAEPPPGGGETSHGPEFQRGDLVLFVSHKPHHVRPVARGTRQVCRRRSRA